MSLRMGKTLLGIGAVALCLFAVNATPTVAAAPTASASDNALRWWIDNAETGRSDFQYTLGRMYETGVPSMSLAADRTRAEHWYRRAAEQGHGDAQLALQRLTERRATEGITPANHPVATPAHPAPVATSQRYWPWWLGGATLAAISIGFWLTLGMPLGVSSSWERLVNWRGYRRAEAADRQLAHVDGRAVTDALLAETLRQFGAAAADQLRAETAAAPQTTVSNAARLPWATHITFLASLIIGGFVAAISTDTFSLKLNLGDAFTRSIGDGWVAAAVLAGGGVLIGFGTRMAGGCSSGHGLTGCARLQPGSLLATASFFGSAVLLTLLLVNL